MQINKRYLSGILFFFIASAFISPPPLYQSKTEHLDENPELADLCVLDNCAVIGPVLSPSRVSDLERAVLEEAVRILGWQYADYDFTSTRYEANSVGTYFNLQTNQEKTVKDLNTDNYLFVKLSINENNDPSLYAEGIIFHGYDASLHHFLQDWELSLIWFMEGYRLSVYTSYGSHSGTPDPMPYGEALYQAFWNVANGTTGGSAAPPAPQNPPNDLCASTDCLNNYCSDDGTKFLYDCDCDPADGKCYCRSDECTSGCDAGQGGCLAGQADLCSGISCKNNYCSDDGSKYLYDCECDSTDGKCHCRSDECTDGCDDDQGGCMLPPEGLCAGVDCSPDYCEDDGQTRNYDCKCDPADGICSCYIETCEAGCNMATGKCVESMVIKDSSGGGGENDYSGNPDDSGGLLDVLGVVGGVAAGGGVIVGGGYLAFKGIQGALARRALSGGAKAAAEAVEPSLSELLARAEQSANRASQAIDQALKGTELDKQRYREMLGRTIQQNEEWARIMDRRAEAIEDAEWYVKGVKKGADISAELIGNVPGVGTAYKYGYNLTTTAIESAAGGDSIGEVVLKTASKGVETATGDLLFGKVTQLESLAKDTVHKTVIKVIKDTGADKIVMEGAKNEGLNNFMNIVKEVKSRSSFGKIEKRVEGVAKRIDRKAIGRMVKRVLYSK